MLLKFFRKNLKVLPPAGNFLPFISVFKKYLEYSEDKLNQEIKDHFPSHNVFTLNSGKSALILVLKSIKEIDSRSTVLMSAYTCPDIAVCAHIAGFKIRLLDTEVNSSKMMVPTLEDLTDTAVIISSNLYGEIDDSSIERICLDNNIFHIDDACQAAHSIKNNIKVGRSDNSIGIFSFGRGKAYSGAGGGILSIPKNEYFKVLSKKVLDNYSTLTKSTYIDSFKYLVKLLGLNILKNPYLYGIVSRISFLNIGETIIDFKFNMRNSSKAELALFSFALSSSNKYNSFSRKALILSKEKRNNIFKESTAKKLGLSSSYPKIILEYKELKELLHEENKNRVFKNAKLLTETILTIPNHDLVSTYDKEQINQLIL